jgi:hypothetical protein
MKYFCFTASHLKAQWLLCISPGLILKNYIAYPDSAFMPSVRISRQIAIIDLYKPTL